MLFYSNWRLFTRLRYSNASNNNQIESNTVTLIKIWVAYLVARCLDTKIVKHIIFLFLISLDDAFLVVKMPNRMPSGVINRAVMRCYHAVLNTYNKDKNQ